MVGLIRNTGNIYMSIMCLGLHGLCGVYTYVVYTDYTDYTDYVRVHVYGSLYEVHQVYETKSGTLDNLYQFCVFHCLPAMVFGQLAAPGFGLRYLIYMATFLRVPPQSRD